MLDAGERAANKSVREAMVAYDTDYLDDTLPVFPFEKADYNQMSS